MFRRACWLLLVAGVLLGAVAVAPADDKDKAESKPKANAKAAPRLPEGTKALRDLAYGTHERQKLDLLLPPGASGPLPLVIWVHGGGWQGGSKDGAHPALPLLARGYAVASINYRLSQHAPFPAQILDCKEAVRFLRAGAKEHGLDPARFGAWGASAGGHLVAMLGTTREDTFPAEPGGKAASSAVQAVCDFFGPTDLPRFLYDLRDAEWRERLTPVLTKLLGGPATEKKDLALAASPLSHVRKDIAPLLIVHGDQDPVVPYVQSERYLEALKKAGADATLFKVEGGGHGPGFDKPEIARAVEAFFDKHLKAR